MLLIPFLYRRKWMNCLDPCEKEGAEPGTESQLLLTHNLLSVFSVHYYHLMHWTDIHKVNSCASWRHQHLSFFYEPLCWTLSFSQLCCWRDLWELFLHHTGTSFPGSLSCLEQDQLTWSGAANRGGAKSFLSSMGEVTSRWQVVTGCGDEWHLQPMRLRRGYLSTA